MDVKQVIDLKKSVVDEYRKKLEAIEIVEQMLAEKEKSIRFQGPHSPLNPPGANGAAMHTAIHTAIISMNIPAQGLSVDDQVIAYAKIIGKEFKVAELYGYAKELNPKMDLTMPEFSTAIWRIKKNPNKTGLLKTIRGQEGNIRPVYQYVGGEE